MHFIKSIFITVLGLSVMTFALPKEYSVADECRDAYRGEHRSCEQGLKQEDRGARQENKGERQIANGNLLGGISNIAQGIGNQVSGQARECGTSRRC